MCSEPSCPSAGMATSFRPCHVSAIVTSKMINYVIWFASPMPALMHTITNYYSGRSGKREKHNHVVSKMRCTPIYPLVNKHSYGKSPCLRGKTSNHVSEQIYCSTLLNYESLHHQSPCSIYTVIYPANGPSILLVNWQLSMWCSINHSLLLAIQSCSCWTPIYGVLIYIYIYAWPSMLI